MHASVLSVSPTLKPGTLLPLCVGGKESKNTGLIFTTLLPEISPAHSLKRKGEITKILSGEYCPNRS